MTATIYHIFMTKT